MIELLMQFGARRAAVCAQEAAQLAQVSVRYAQEVLEELHTSAQVYVMDWVRMGSRGPPAPAYAWGQGQDAPAPTMTKAPIKRDWHATSNQGGPRTPDIAFAWLCGRVQAMAESEALEEA